ncbi:Coenzyme F420 hydrogenase/dehydrogenase, beta subunit C-terminal domain [Desulfomicrobium baculatum]|uniref:4Fe-4S ferredoxin iron-sulfur binding domain protein n=1 Tax=Desulfomicrobium baculatum (strain DSM 4028 / VKM B-1378 / X) TaxID=525897 RepID=C7LS77_DESBD|nr:Coenzyme F420 hydrogenase/dehydrogenase, beta subunit C-terminal domain [Desulfomicrobium baculatum]ACU90625.1 4Fe-4S ferredoxin iron-sulfur binding domain protein [Desulfomicrobium baculatum DSM 4028]
MSTPILCPSDYCTGCEACRNICPEQCITMVADYAGFLRPVIDADRCVGCLLCEKSCPVLLKPKLDNLSDPHTFACWHKNDEVRARSSSGGAFSALAKYVLNEDGFVFGAAYDENLYVRHICIEKINDLDLLRRSKYVQSEIGSSFRQVKDYLKSKRFVLFVGAPCQIAGLISFLGKKYDNLLTIDFVCHGVPSPLVLSSYIKFISNKYKTIFIDLNFRDKRNGWENNAVIATNEYKKEYHLKGSANSYFNGFISNTFLRDSCYQCPFIGMPRYGDITLGDFWGIQRDKTISQNEIDKGISLLLLNNESVYGKIRFPLEDLVSFEKDFKDASAGNSPVFTPAFLPETRGNFFEELKFKNYDEVASKYLNPPLKRRLTQFIKDNFGSIIISKLRKAKSIIK